MFVWKITGAIAALAITTSAVLACQGPEVFSDDFSDPILSADLWGTADNPSVSMGQGYLEIKPDRGYTYRMEIPSGPEEFDVCVDVTFPEAKNPDGGTQGGVMFWWKDWDNYYQVTMTPVGGVGVFRRSKGKMVAISAPFKIYNPVKKGAGTTNTLRVALKGSVGTVYANNERLTAFKVVAADAAAAQANLALYGQSEADQQNGWRFSKVKVAEPQ